MVAIDPLDDFARRGMAAPAAVDAAGAGVARNGGARFSPEVARALTVAGGLLDAAASLKGGVIPIDVYVRAIGGEVEAMRAELRTLGLRA